MILKIYFVFRLFVQSDRECRAICEETPDCRFYYWYPIDYSPSPLYCYLFRRWVSVYALSVCVPVLSVCAPLLAAVGSIVSVPDLAWQPIYINFHIKQSSRSWEMGSPPYSISAHSCLIVHEASIRVWTMACCHMLLSVTYCCLSYSSVSHMLMSVSTPCLSHAAFCRMLMSGT